MATVDDKKIIFSMVGVSKIIPQNRKQILKDIYLSFFYGAKIGIIGLNGAGKSTLMKIIAGLDQPTQGEVVWSPGYSVGYLPQDPPLNEAKTVKENVMEGVQQAYDALKEYEEINEKFGLEEYYGDPEKMDKLMEHEAPWDKIIFEYYMNFIPYFSNLFSPLFVFIAVIFFTSKLAENSEIIAMFSTGMSFKRMMRPYMISAAIIAAATFMMSSFIIPKGSVTRLNFEDKYIKPKKVNSVRNVQLEVDSGVIAYIDNYNDGMKTGNRFSLDKFVDKKLVSHLTARRITYDTTTVNKWTIHDYMVRELDGLKEKITKGDRIDSIINMDPSDFLIMKNQQEMLTSPELSEYIEKQKRRGFANIKEFEIEYHKRIAMSFASFILTIIGVSLSSRKTKGGMGLHLGIGLGLSFSYILFQTITSTFAINGNVPPAIAVWIPNILYAGIAFYLYQKAPK